MICMMLTDTIELCTPIAGKEGEITCTWDQWIDCNAFKGCFIIIFHSTIDLCNN